MRTLHTTCTDPLQVFAWHDVYRHLEQCSDDCERVANTIDSNRHEKQLEVGFSQPPSDEPSREENAGGV